MDKHSEQVAHPGQHCTERLAPTFLLAFIFSVNKKICLEFYYNLSSYSQISLNKIGIIKNRFKRTLSRSNAELTGSDTGDFFGLILP